MGTSAIVPYGECIFHGEAPGPLRAVGKKPPQVDVFKFEIMGSKSVP